MCQSPRLSRSNKDANVLPQMLVHHCLWQTGRWLASEEDDPPVVQAEEEKQASLEPCSSVCGPTPAATLSSGSLLAMQDLWSHPIPSEFCQFKRSLGGRYREICCIHSPRVTVGESQLVNPGGSASILHGCWLLPLPSTSNSLASSLFQKTCQKGRFLVSNTDLQDQKLWDLDSAIGGSMLYWEF